MVFPSSGLLSPHTPPLSKAFTYSVAVIPDQLFEDENTPTSVAGLMILLIVILKIFLRIRNVLHSANINGL